MTSAAVAPSLAEDQPHFTTKQWSIVSPGSDQSATGPVRKSRIGEVIRDTSLRRKPQKFPDWAVTCLTQWFAEHASYPYPTPEEKEMLAEQTKLSEVQINYWFSNARRRRSKKEKQGALSSSQGTERGMPGPPSMMSASPDPNFGRGSAHQIVSKQPPMHTSPAQGLTIPTHQLQPHFGQQSHQMHSPPAPLYPGHHPQPSNQMYPHPSSYSQPPMPPPSSMGHSMPHYPMHAMPPQYAQVPPPPPPSSAHHHHHMYHSGGGATGIQLPPLVQSPPSGPRQQLPLPFPSLPPPPKD